MDRVERARWHTILIGFALLVVPLATTGEVNAGPLPQDDAGSGQDAPDEPGPGIWIGPDTAYHGNTTGILGDTQDWYALQAEAGDWLQLTALGGNCGSWALVDSNGEPLDGQCSAPPAPGNTEVWVQTQIPESDTYFLGFAASPPFKPDTYRFEFTFTNDPADGPPSAIPDDLLPEEIPPQDDAGSGQDAPDDPEPEVWIGPETAYQGNTTGVLGDTEDWYAFEAQAGDWVQLQATGGHCNTWSVHESTGASIESDCRALSQESVEVWLQTQVEADGLYFIRFNANPAPTPHTYRFETILSDVPSPPPEGVFSFSPDNTHLGVDNCPQAPAAEAERTHGAGDPRIESLSWAALRTGFRAVVTWESPDPALSSLRVLQTNGETTVFTNPIAKGVHAFVVDGLPVGEILCFQAEYDTGFGAVTSDWHAVRLENAMNAYDEEAGAYTLNLLVLANEHATGHARVQDAVDLYAERLWDATEGHVRSGAVITLFGDYEKHNSGLITCGIYPVTPLPTCNTEADVVFSYDNLPFAAGATFRDGIQTPTRAIFMNNLWEGPISSPSSIASTLLHELGHYAFGMMDLYTSLGQGPNCWDPVTRISVMGNNPGAREFDDETTRCPNEDAIIAEYGGYTPTWTSLITRYPQIPERPGDPVPGPSGDGGIHHQHVYGFIETPQVDLPQDDAGSGQDAADSNAPEIWIEPGVKYQGNTTGANGDEEDWYAFEATAGSTLHLRAWGGNCITWEITDASGDALDPDCSAPIVPPDGVTIEVPLDDDGLHFLRFTSNPSSVPVHYRFAFAFDEAPPEPLP